MLCQDKNKKCIRIREPMSNNLKNIKSGIPRDELVVLTGLSGSGKSSLALYHLCRRTAQIYGVVVILCQNVPGTDGEAGCGKHRRTFAGNFN